MLPRDSRNPRGVALRRRQACGYWWWARAAGSMRCAGRSPPRRSRPSFSAPRAMPGSPRRPNACPSPPTISSGCVAFAVEQKIDFVVVGPEAPAGPGPGRPAGGGRHQGLRPQRRGGRPGRLQGLHEGSLREARDPHRRLCPLHRARPGQGLCRRPSAARRRQGRWARRRQGRGDRRDAGRGHGGHRQHDGRPGLRRGRGGAGDRGIPRGRGAQLLRAGGRQDRAPAGLRPGSQARRRRRHRPQHRRHGRLFPGPGRHGGAGGGDHGRASSSRRWPPWRRQGGPSRACSMPG